MKRSLFSLACLAISLTALSACNPDSSQPPRSSSIGSDGRPAGNNGNSTLQGDASSHGNHNGNGNGDSSSQQSTPQQDSTTIAALSLGIPPASQVDLNLNAPSNVSITPNPDSLSAPAPSSVPEPTTAIFVGSGICFFIVSRLRKRQEIFDYYNK